MNHPPNPNPYISLRLACILLLQHCKCPYLSPSCSTHRYLRPQKRESRPTKTSGESDALKTLSLMSLDEPSTTSSNAMMMLIVLSTLYLSLKFFFSLAVIPMISLQMKTLETWRLNLLTLMPHLLRNVLSGGQRKRRHTRKHAPPLKK